MSELIVCSDKTGRARGTLEPVIFFEDEHGYVILPTYDAGKPEQARAVYETRYRNHVDGTRWAWRTTDGTLTSVRALETRLIEQERQRTERMRINNQMAREASRAATRDRLYARMVSSSTTPFERDAIRIWLDKRDDPARDKIEQEMTHHNWYLWAMHQDSNTRVEDKAMQYEGEFWRSPEAQK